ncbi:Chromosome segregation in meiosis protein 3 [Spathaspora sp. JA1]|nr:Chromosome segregation in meiosis protein 3 [Spathaspora sp. JA1]
MEQQETNPVDEDILGLDQPLKLKKRAKIARIDNQRIFNPNGIPYIIKNHSQITRTISRNDRHFQKKYPLASKGQKLEHEYNNLVSVLQFYQLWCHGFFPKANFKDCIQLIRGLGGKSPQLKLYRRQLIEVELNKLRIEKGIVESVPEPIDVEQGEVGAFDVPDVSMTSANNTGAEAMNDDDEDDDWDFMNVAAPRNRLFVDDDDEDDLYQVPEHPVETRSNVEKLPEQTSNPEDEFELAAAEAEGVDHHQEEDDENDLELMREFGM